MESFINLEPQNTKEEIDNTEDVDPTEKEILNTKDILELFELLDKMGGIQGSSEFHSAEKIKGQIILTIRDANNLLAITRQFGLRKQVLRLLKNLPVGIKDNPEQFITVLKNSLDK